MIRQHKERRGVALFIALTTTLIVVILANVILNIIASHSRLTHHEVSRIQAYYAAQAALVYVRERFRTAPATDTDWKPNSNQDRYYCMERSGADRTPVCVDSPLPSGALCIAIPYDGDLSRNGAYKIQVKAYKTGTGSAPLNTVRLDAKVDYTYTP